MAQAYHYVSYNGGEFLPVQQEYCLANSVHLELHQWIHLYSVETPVVKADASYVKRTTHSFAPVNCGKVADWSRNI
jgi:acyl carrier protein phosphodiesterase